MQVILVFTYDYEGCGIQGVYSSQELADAQIRRYVSLENAMYMQINIEHDDNDPFRFKLYQEAANADRLTFDQDGKGITSRVITVDAPIELIIPPWLKDVPEGAVLA